MLRRAAKVALIALTAACSLPGGGGPAPSLKIGVDLPLSGAEAAVGVPVLDGVRLYVMQHPTVAGFTVDLVVKDDTSGGASEPPLGAANVEGFASDPAVMGVIGPLDAAVARAEIPVANLAALALVSPATSSPCLTRDNYLPAELNNVRVPIKCKDVGLQAASDLRPSGVNNFFRLTTTDDLQGPAAADFAYQNLHLLRVATVSDGEGYGQALAAAFATRFRALGGSIVRRLDSQQPASADLLTFLQNAKADGAQAVYYGGTSTNHGCAVRAQMAAAFGASGEAAPMLGGDAIAQDPTCLQDASSNSAAIYATVPAIDADSVGTAAPVISAFKSAFPNPRDYSPYAVLAYDAAAVLYRAVERAITVAGSGLPNRVNVISQLSVTSGFSGATGLFGFDANGDTTQRMLTVFESPAGDAGGAWRVAGQVDYTSGLPY